MNAKNGFNNEKPDAQGTFGIETISPENFDFEKYQDYENQLLAQNKKFWQGDSGIAVYRRFRVPEVFSYGCKDMKLSLELQLGALEKSMDYQADIANFLEPWYGVGITASAFNCKYKWAKGQAPAIESVFKNVVEALNCEIVPIKKTEIGRHTLEMADYFVQKTKGKLPISLTDTQTPLNTASFIIDTTSMLLGMYDNPEDFKKLLNTLSDLLIEFTRKQIEILGDTLVKPGHGFASSRNFEGFGMSDDVILMLSPDQYKQFGIPYLTKIGKALNGAVFHSCGNWSDRIDVVNKIDNLLMVDGAFTGETDPNPNPVEPFANSYSNSTIVLNARLVGSPEHVFEQVKKLWKPPMKLIIVTYSQTSEEQALLYELLHTIE